MMFTSVHYWALPFKPAPEPTQTLPFIEDFCDTSPYGVIGCWNLWVKGLIQDSQDSATLIKLSNTTEQEIYYIETHRNSRLLVCPKSSPCPFRWLERMTSSTCISSLTTEGLLWRTTMKAVKINLSRFGLELSTTSNFQILWFIFVKRVLFRWSFV